MTKKDYIVNCPTIKIDKKGGICWYYTISGILKYHGVLTKIKKNYPHILNNVLFQKGEGLPTIYQKSLLTQLGFKFIKVDRKKPFENIASYIEKYGPLYVSSRRPAGGHANIVSGIRYFPDKTALLYLIENGKATCQLLSTRRRRFKNFFSKSSKKSIKKKKKIYGKWKYIIDSIEYFQDTPQHLSKNFDIVEGFYYFSGIPQQKNDNKTIKAIHSKIKKNKNIAKKIFDYHQPWRSISYYIDACPGLFKKTTSDFLQILYVQKVISDFYSVLYDEGGFYPESALSKLKKKLKDSGTSFNMKKFESSFLNTLNALLSLKIICDFRIRLSGLEEISKSKMKQEYNKKSKLNYIKVNGNLSGHYLKHSFRYINASDDYDTIMKNIYASLDAINFFRFNAYPLTIVPLPAEFIQEYHDEMLVKIAFPYAYLKCMNKKTYRKS